MKYLPVKLQKLILGGMEELVFDMVLMDLLHTLLPLGMLLKLFQHLVEFLFFHQIILKKFVRPLWKQSHKFGFGINI